LIGNISQAEIFVQTPLFPIYNNYTDTILLAPIGSSQRKELLSLGIRHIGNFAFMGNISPETIVQLNGNISPETIVQLMETLALKQLYN
jgi:hypothetical protein